tara:strand:- start:229 stop:354 length:126 start_codon:yes stop_codon:yes gene_type:complete
MKKHKKENEVSYPWEKFFQTKTYKINKNESTKKNNPRKNTN